MRTMGMLGAALLGLATPLASQSRWSVEGGSTAAHLNDTNEWSVSYEGRMSVDVSNRARVHFGLAYWSDPFRDNGSYTWQGIGADVGASFRLVGNEALALRGLGLAHVSVGGDGDGTPWVHIGPSVGLRGEAHLAGPLRFFLGGAGHLFVTTSGDIDPGGSMHAGLGLRL